MYTPFAESSNFRVLVLVEEHFTETLTKNKTIKKKSIHKAASEYSSSSSNFEQKVKFKPIVEETQYL